MRQESVHRRINWLTSIKQWQTEFLGSVTAREFVDAITDDLLQKGVFAFTPKGEASLVFAVPPVCLRARVPEALPARCP